MTRPDKPFDVFDPNLNWKNLDYKHWIKIYPLRDMKRPHLIVLTSFEPSQELVDKCGAAQEYLRKCQRLQTVSDKMLVVVAPMQGPREMPEEVICITSMGGDAIEKLCRDLTDVAYKTRPGSRLYLGTSLQ